jgi:FkbM family methyltransferase
MPGALYQRINKPYYVFRPSQLWRRLRLGALEQRSPARLPWGLEIEFNPAEAIGNRLATNGVLDLEVTEALFRLVEPGEIAVDAGANIGYMASIMAFRVGPRGRVLAFEPHPYVFKRLLANLERWVDDARTGTVDPRCAALAAHAGSAMLRTNNDTFVSNEGSAALMTVDCARGAADVTLHEVELVRLDDAVSDDESVGVLKIDVEGGELGVLEGARRMLGDGRVRDIIFEEHHGYPAPTTKLLESLGYTVLRPECRLLGPWLSPASVPPSGRWRGDVSFIATRAPERAVQRLAARGWSALRPRESFA